MLRSLWIRLRGAAGDLDSLDEELRLHFDREVERNVALGMSPADARAAAQRAFGSMTSHQEAARSAWRWNWVEQITQDLRYAARQLRRDRIFAIAAIVSLGIGMGATASVYAVGRGLLRRPLPVPHPEQLVTLIERYPGRTRDQLAFDMYLKLRDEPRLFAGLAAVNVFDRSNVSVSGAGAASSGERARVAIATGNYFSVFGVGAALGRTFTQNDDRALGAHPVAVISDRYWRTHLGGASDVLDRIVTINRTPFVIVGVMSPAFTGDWVGRPADIWVPFSMHLQVLVEVSNPLIKHNDAWLRLVGRLPARVSIEQAAPVVQSVYKRTMFDWAGPNVTDVDRKRLADWTLDVEPNGHGYLPQRADFEPKLRILALIVGLTLLVACVNVIGLLLARAAARSREMAVRRAIGAGSWRLARQLIVEGLVLSALGGVVGLVLASWGTNALVSRLGAAPVPMFWATSNWMSFDAALDARTVAMMMAICIASGVAFGLAPFVVRSHAITSALRGRGGASQAGSSRFPLGKVMVVTQLALSLVVVVTAGLFVQTLRNLRETPLGFDRSRVLLVWTQASGVAHSPAELRDVWATVQRRIAEIPGVEAVGASNSGLLNGFVPPAQGVSVNPMRVPGQPPKPTTVSATRSFVSPGYFSAIGIPLVSGRDFTHADADTLHRVVIINQTLARHYFGNADPVGTVVSFSPDSVPNTTIIGVAKDVVEGTPRAINASQMRTFFNYRDRESRRRLDAMMVAVRTRGDPRALAPAVREAVRSAQPALPVLDIDTADEQLDVVLASERLITAIAAIFGAIALLLSCVGLYGLTAFVTARRTNEIGIRMALGASRRATMAMVLADATILVAIGAVLGIAGSFATGRLVASQLFGVGSADIGSLIAAIAILAIVGVLAAALPARRAAAIDPMTALRTD